jgi:hypothetical protein
MRIRQDVDFYMTDFRVPLGDRHYLHDLRSSSELISPTGCPFRALLCSSAACYRQSL